MSPDTVIEELERELLPQVAGELCGDGWRLVQMMGTPRKETIEVLVSFDKAYELRNFRIPVARDDLTLPSITGATLAALSYENELQDLFGFKVTDLAVDYGGNFLRCKKVHPLADLFDPAAEKKAAAGRKTGDGKTVPVSGVNRETRPAVDDPGPKD